MENYDIRKALELEWLKANSVNGTPEGVNTDEKEYKRTMCSIALLNAVLDGDYEAFSACQPESTRITRESFSEIHDYVTSVLKTEDDQNAMRVFLVINDLGKVDDFVKKIEKTLRYRSVDHDKILYEGLKAHPEYSPTFNSLKAKYRRIILAGLKTAFNMGQFVQCECLPANLAPLKKIDAEELDYYMIHVLFDIAGAAGHVNSNGSLVCNELYWKRFSWALTSIHNMMDGIYKPKEAYDDYLEKTMEYFHISDPVIAKLCNMIRASTPEEAKQIEDAFKGLSGYDEYVMRKELEATGIGSNGAILLYYAPATFVNALNYYKKTRPEIAISKTIKQVCPALVNIYDNIRMLAPCNEGVTTCFIAEVAEAAKDPDNLDGRMEFRRVGNDVAVKWIG